MKDPVACLATLAAFISFTTLANAGPPLAPFESSVLKADLATAAGMADFKAAIDATAAKSMAYIDWHLLHFTKSGVFSSLMPPNAAPNDDVACEELAKHVSGKLQLLGTVDPNDNHMLAEFRIDYDHLPAFTLIDCEPVIGAGETGLRIRGFFYVPDVKIETAQQYAFIPLDVDPTRIPAGFFQAGP